MSRNTLEDAAVGLAQHERGRSDSSRLRGDLDTVCGRSVAAASSADALGRPGQTTREGAATSLYPVVPFIDLTYQRASYRHLTLAEPSPP